MFYCEVEDCVHLWISPFFICRQGITSHYMLEACFGCAWLEREQKYREPEWKPLSFSKGKKVLVILGIQRKGIQKRILVKSCNFLKLQQRARKCPNNGLKEKEMNITFHWYSHHKIVWAMLQPSVNLFLKCFTTGSAKLKIMKMFWCPLGST